MSFSFWEIALIGIILLIIFGAGKFPKMAGDLAKGIKTFKKGLQDQDDASPASTASTATPADPTPSTPVALPGQNNQHNKNTAA